jgi:hypothetical protein
LGQTGEIILFQLIFQPILKNKKSGGFIMKTTVNSIIVKIILGLLTYILSEAFHPLFGQGGSTKQGKLVMKVVVDGKVVVDTTFQYVNGAPDMSFLGKYTGKPDLYAGKIKECFEGDMNVCLLLDSSASQVRNKIMIWHSGEGEGGKEASFCFHIGDKEGMMCDTLSGARIIKKVMADGGGSYVIVSPIEGESVETEETDGRTWTIVTTDEAKEGKKIKIHKVIDAGAHDSLITVYTGDDKMTTDTEYRYTINKNMEGKRCIIKVVIEAGGNGEARQVETSTVVISVPEETDLKQIQEEMPDKGMEIDNKELNAGDLMFYPNPSQGKFNLSFNLESKGKTLVRLYDMKGNTVYKEDLEDFSGMYSKEIDISDRGSGTFFLSITQGNRRITRKILVE